MPPTGRARPPRPRISKRCSPRGKTSTTCAAHAINATRRFRNQSDADASAPRFLLVARADASEPDDPEHRVDRSGGADGPHPVDRGGPVFGPHDRPAPDGISRARSAARAGFRTLPAGHLVDIAGAPRHGLRDDHRRAIAIVDLRLMGLASRERAAGRVASEVLRCTWAAFALATITGALLFSSNAFNYAHNSYFQAKLAFLDRKSV